MNPPPPMMVPPFQTMVPPPQAMVPPPPAVFVPPMMVAPPPEMIDTQALPTPPVPAFQPYLHDAQPIFNIPGVIHPEVTQLPPASPVPIYDARNHDNMGLVRSSLPPRMSQSSI